MKKILPLVVLVGVLFFSVGLSAQTLGAAKSGVIASPSAAGTLNLSSQSSALKTGLKLSSEKLESVLFRLEKISEKINSRTEKIKKSGVRTSTKINSQLLSNERQLTNLKTRVGKAQILSARLLENDIGLTDYKSLLGEIGEIKNIAKSILVTQLNLVTLLKPYSLKASPSAAVLPVITSVIDTPAVTGFTK